MTLDKIEEEQMREAFEKWYNTGKVHYTLRELAYLGWMAGSAHANSKHSAIIEERDRLAKLCDKQAEEIEDLQYRLQGEFDRGMDAARKEIQSVEVGENSPDSLENWISDKPVMRIQFYADSGDMSAGIWPSSGWEVSADQIGTVLEELLSSLSAANATIAMLRAVINESLQENSGEVAECKLHYALSNTQAAADAFTYEIHNAAIDSAAEVCDKQGRVMIGNAIRKLRK